MQRFSQKIPVKERPKKRKKLRLKNLFPKVATGYTMPVSLDVVTRYSRKGKPKRLQIVPELAELLRKNHVSLKEFLRLRQIAKFNGKAKGRSFSIELFDPQDKSKNHDYLYVVNFKGRKFFVKEIVASVYPTDPVTQFALHDKVSSFSKILSQWNARVIKYVLGWKGKHESFLIANWEPGIMLEKQMQKNPCSDTTKNYIRFLRAERFLRENFGLKDVTTKNTIVNPRTKELIILDLLPGKSSESAK